MDGSPPDSLQVRPAHAVPPLRIRDARDACDAVLSSLPAHFDEGVLVVLLDDVRSPLVALAVDGAPSDDLGPIAELVVTLRHGSPGRLAAMAAVVLGIIRPGWAGTAEPAAPSGRLRWLPSSDIVAWLEFGRRLGDVGTTLVDVVVLEADGWFALSDRARD